MKKLMFILISSCLIWAQNLYFDAFMNLQKAKRLMNSNPEKAKVLFIEAYSNLKRISNESIDNKKPSPNAFNLLGEMYINGWGVEQNKEKGVKFLCAAKQLGNTKATNTLAKMNVTCQKINFKELKQ